MWVESMISWFGKVTAIGFVVGVMEWNWNCLVKKCLVHPESAMAWVRLSMIVGDLTLLQTKLLNLKRLLKLRMLVCLPHPHS